LINSDSLSRGGGGFKGADPVGGEYVLRSKIKVGRDFEEGENGGRY
jgi:hypothetical protein